MRRGGGGTLPSLQLLFRWAGSTYEPKGGISPHTAGHIGYVSLIPLRMGRARDAAGRGSGGLDLTLEQIVILGRVGIGVP